MGSYDPNIHHRQSIRLRGFDYSSPNAYFVTMCVKDRENLFGTIENEIMKLNSFGEIVSECIRTTPTIRQEIEFDEWIMMPNHLHAIICIVPTVGAHGNAPSDGSFDVSRSSTETRAHYHAPLRMPKSISTCIAGMKRITTMNINKIRGTPSLPVWQRNYHEHIIRSDADLYRIRQYIRDNPMQWSMDPENITTKPKIRYPPNVEMAAEIH